MAYSLCLLTVLPRTGSVLPGLAIGGIARAKASSPHGIGYLLLRHSSKSLKVLG